ncbi:ADC synthase [Myxozyma melibiosi]|uniref:aminodeoxychorismate synthase n=1 Tax=Myxozyma melibiosi TaxID=54550 RepID=A0ABR1F5E5_9ASCO
MEATAQQRRRLYRILLIDSHDSFTFNLVSLFSDLSIRPQITVITSDKLLLVSSDLLLALVLRFDAVVIGPGPGTPVRTATLGDSDMGGIPRVWETIKSASRTCELIIPPPVVIGICLGFQWMLLDNGHRVVRLPKPRHGLVSVLDVCEQGKSDMFSGLDDKPIECVRYHSLHVVYDPKVAGNDDYIPLAWSSDCHEEGEKVLMAARHRRLPYWAMQYHPESICSEYGSEVFENIFSLSAEHTSSRRAFIDHFLSPTVEPQQAPPQPQLHLRTRILAEDDVPLTRHLRQAHYALPADLDVSEFVVTFCEYLHREFGEYALLDSAAAPGQWTYICCKNDTTKNFTYFIPDDFMTVEQFDKKNQRQTYRVKDIDDVWEILAATMDVTIDSFTDTLSSKTIPISQYPTFFGGMVGYVSYEAGVVDGLGLSVERESDASVPDIDLTYYERTLAIDLERKILYTQSIEVGDGYDSHGTTRDWEQKVQALSLAAIENVRATRAETETSSDSGASTGSITDQRRRVPKAVRLPVADDYRAKIDQAQGYLASGDSYELCVTDQTIITENPGVADAADNITPALADELESAWWLYKHMREQSPSPYAMFYSSSATTLLGMSPERFLFWDDNLQSCELRPIKGTVKNDGHETLASATRKLSTPKERAENLMIVDLIRHDLAHFCNSVKVSKLMGVETYKTVYQLVSAIQGTDFRPGVSGIDVLRGCLPPGSMTGAPKRRSVELLQQIEGHRRRGVYSGVSGYWSVLGFGDWSVVIRSAFSVGGCRAGREREWRIGAGGAITALSDRDGEWEEMCVKLQSAMRAFPNAEQ